MHTLQTQVVRFLATVIFTLTSISLVSAKEINTESFQERLILL
jgi:hypothetical protein